jgi:hypothetical protein
MRTTPGKRVASKKRANEEAVDILRIAHMSNIPDTTTSQGDGEVGPQSPSSCLAMLFHKMAEA